MFRNNYIVIINYRKAKDIGYSHRSVFYIM